LTQKKKKRKKRKGGYTFEVPFMLRALRRWQPIKMPKSIGEEELNAPTRQGKSITHMMMSGRLHEVKLIMWGRVRGGGGGGHFFCFCFFLGVSLFSYTFTFVTRVGRESDSSMLQYGWYMYYYSLLMQFFQQKMPQIKAKTKLGSTLALVTLKCFFQCKVCLCNKIQRTQCPNSRPKLSWAVKMPFALWALISFTPEP
jgi:hypothetical protein